MAANLYCSRADVTRRLPPGSITSRSGLIADSSNGTDAFTFDGHGFEDGDRVTVRAIEGGSLPAPLVNGGTYYAIRDSISTFKLSASSTLGMSIDLTTVAVSMVVSREPDFEAVIEFYSRWADTSLPAHLVPLEIPIHPFVRGIVADLSAKRILNEDGKDSAIINEAEIASKAQLERFSSGLKLRGAPVTASANVAIRNTLAATNDPRGWGSGRLP